MTFDRRRRGIAVALALTMALVTNSLGFLMLANRVQAAPPPPQRLTLKWVKDVGICTYVGPLAADLIPEPPGSPRVLEIVVTGVSVIESTPALTNGNVTVLNGANGNVLWSKQPGTIINHSPVEIGDLNRDGVPEIVVANLRSTSALFANGSLYWKNNAAPSYDLYSAIGDVNQDGYPEVFVSSGQGPFEGVDYITELSHDGQILAQSNTSWHPCWGGLALGDPKFDGNYILLQGDRSSSYSNSGDPYKGGGWGVRAFDARTLTPLWNDSQILCSSHIPMFVDVDGDGVLDVVVAWQSRGLAVYNALNGSVLTSGGIYRKTSNLNLSSHSQPTIYDIDGDGHPEIIVNYDSNPKIFDLYTWTLDATLNVSTGEPPKMGRVTADPTQMNIILVEGNNIHIYNQQYQEVDNATGLDSPNQSTLVADVDGDGYNELILSTRSGKVYCYGTPALASNPQPRSNVAFYSDYRRGVAEFVEPLQIRWKLTVNSAHDSPNPSIGDHFYSNGSSVTCSVTSPVTEGGTVWTCTGWSGTGSVPASGSGSSVTFTITMNSTITWNWQGVPVKYGLNVQVSGSGVTNATGTVMYDSGTVVHVLATPSAGWTLNKWLLNGSDSGSANPYTLTMTANYNLTAIFTPTQENAYLVVRGASNAIWYRIYNSTSSTWENWNLLPGATCDSPAATVCGGQLYIVVRGMDGQTLWSGSINLTDRVFSGWTVLSGASPSAPTLVSYDSKLVLVVRGFTNTIYYRSYDCVSLAWTEWTPVADGATCDSPAAAILGTDLHLVIRGFSTTEVSGNNTLWHGTVNLTDKSFSGWISLRGATPSAPRLAASETLNKLYLSVRGMSDVIWINTWNGTAWEGWAALPDGATCDAPAVTVMNGELHIAVRNLSGDALWHYYINLSTEAHSGWIAIDGFTPSAPTLAG